MTYVGVPPKSYTYMVEAKKSHTSHLGIALLNSQNHPQQTRSIIKLHNFLSLQEAVPSVSNILMQSYTFFFRKSSGEVDSNQKVITD